MEYTFYKIQVGNECYVGSTIDFKNRMSKHKHSCCNKENKDYKIKVYQSIREVGWDNIDIMIIDKIIFNSKNEALDMETKYMLMFDAKLNSCYPKRTKEEYYEANKEKVKQKQKEWNNNNRERMLQMKKEYRTINRESIFQKQKEWRTINRESILQRQKEWRTINRERLLQKQKEYNKNDTKRIEKCCCDICGVEMLKRSLPKHKKNKH